MSRPAWLLPVAVIILAGRVLCAQPLDDRLSLEVRADYALDFDGYIKVREHGLKGERLGLHDDLGVRQWFSMSLEAAWRFDQWNGVRAAFSWNQFRGGKTFDHDVTHDGAIFGAGTTVDVAPTRWWRAGLWYELTPWRAGWGKLTLLAGVTLDDLNVFLRPNRKLLGSKQEYHEDFGAQRTPLPAFGARFSVEPCSGLHVAFEARGTYVQNLATWYFEGGRIYHSQANLQLGMEASYSVRQVSFGTAWRYRSFRIHDESKEDGNRFAVRGFHIEWFIRVTL